MVGLAEAKMFLKGIATEDLETASKLCWGSSWAALEKLGNTTSCA